MLGTQTFNKAERAEFIARRAMLELADHFHTGALGKLQEIGQVLKMHAASRNLVEGGAQAESASGGIQASLEQAGKQLGEALRELQVHQPGAIVNILGQSRHPYIEQLKSDFQAMGFTVAQIFWFFSEMIRARKSIQDVLQSVKSGEEWGKLTAYFTNHTNDPHQWGFPHTGGGDIDPVLQRFVSACRTAGITPSCYFLYAAASLLAHGHEEAVSAQ